MTIWMVSPNTKYRDDYFVIYIPDILWSRFMYYIYEDILIKLFLMSGGGGGIRENGRLAWIAINVRVVGHEECINLEKTRQMMDHPAGERAVRILCGSDDVGLYTKPS